MDRPVSRKKALIIKAGIAAIIALALIGAGLYWWLRGTQWVPMTQVRLVTVESIQAEETIVLEAEMAAQSKIVLSSNRAGIVSELFVSDGQSVTEGEALLALDNPEYTDRLPAYRTRVEERLAQVQSLSMSIERSRYTHERTMIQLNDTILRKQQDLESKRQLAEEGFLPLRQIAELENEIRRQQDLSLLEVESYQRLAAMERLQLQSYERSLLEARRELAQAESDAERSVIRASAAGQLSGFTAKIGEGVQTGQRIGEIWKTDQPILQAVIDEYYLGKIKVGQTANLEFQGEKFQLEVSRVDTQIKKGGFRVTWSWLSSKPQDFSFGQTVRLSHFLDRQTATPILSVETIPENWSQGLAYVLTSDRTAKLKRVQFGDIHPEYIEINAGLKTGESVVILSSVQEQKSTTRKIVLY